MKQIVDLVLNLPAWVWITIVAHLLVLGTVAVGQWIGTSLAARFRWVIQPFWAGLLGMTVLFLVSLIPFIGFAVHLVAHILGIGSVMQSRFRVARVRVPL